MIFIENGFYDIGYEINKKIHMKVRFPGKTVIGGYEVCFDKRNLFVYKTSSHCQAFIIRKQKWRELESQHRECYDYIKRKSLLDYMTKIRKPLLAKKEDDIEHYDLRADYK